MKKFLIFGLFCGAFLAVRFSGESPVADSGRGQGGVTVFGNGDVNGDGSLDLSDAIYLLSHLFQGGPAPELCPVVGPAEETACDDNVDDDGDGDTDCDDSDCYQGVNCPANEDCDDNVDNDGDGATDCDDWDCSNSDLSCTPLPLPGFTYEGKNAQGYHEWTHDHTNIRMVQLPGGIFDMGAQKADSEGPNFDPDAGYNGHGVSPPAGTHNEQPVHSVILSPFLIGKYELTNKEYSDLTGGDPPLSPHAFEDDHPVDSARYDSLHDVRGNFLDQTLLRLPSEAQWEYACRAGTTTVYSAGNSASNDLPTVAWFSENSDIGSEREPHPVGLKLPNQFGIHDMHGNVWEFVEDYYFSDFYDDATAPTPSHPATDPLATLAGGPSGSTRTCEGNTLCTIIRGGKWQWNVSSHVSSEYECRSAHRGGTNPAGTHGSGQHGLRLSLPLPTGLGPEFDCTDGVDDDGDGDTDCADFDCFGNAGCALAQETSCDDGQDNDGDGLVDCDDCDCDCTPEAISGFTVEPCNAQGYREWTHTQTGMRFVMLAGPGRMGGQSADPWDWNYDPRSQRFLVNDADATRMDTRNEGPVHEVTLSPYLIGKYEVTQAEFVAGGGSNGSTFQGGNCSNPGQNCDDRPVENVRWVDLYTSGPNPPGGAEKGFLEAAELRLPSEAQWEYACRAGQPGPFSGTGHLDDMGWFNTNLETHDVGLKMPNQFGIHDMHGNVYEWVRDIYQGSSQGSSADGEPNFYDTPEGSGLDPLNEPPLPCRTTDPATCGPCSYEFCAIYRGGWYGTDGSGNSSRPTCRSAARSVNAPTASGSSLGLRAAFYPIPGR